MLERYRSEVGPRLDRLAEPFLMWSPNTLSWVSFALSALAAVLLTLLRFFAYPTPWVPVLFLRSPRSPSPGESLTPSTGTWPESGVSPALGVIF
jgi:hypothetical protein